MRQLKIAGAGLTALAALAAFSMALSEPLQALERLGVSEEEARESIWQSLSGGYFSYPMRPSIKQVAPADRAALVVLIGNFAKAYTATDAFAELYRQYREDRKPSPPEMPASADAERQKLKEEYSKSIREMQEVMKSMPAEQRQVMEETLAMFREQLKSLDDPDNPMFGSDMDEMKRQGYEMQMDDYRARLAEWEQNYPESPEPMIRQRLTEFLAESDGVDFDAALTRRADGKMIFENPSYERKPSNWKLCFRAGRETVEAARSFARQWLNDLDSGR